jgi:SET domain-containing protein
MKPKIRRGRSKIHGRGIFATAPIRKGEEIIEYKGHLISHEEADRQDAFDLETGHTFLFVLNEQWVIDAKVRGNAARWINNSCSPNTEAFVHDHESGDPRRSKVIIEARRDIKAGDELTYDYRIELNSPPTAKQLKAWACRCGSPRCRGTMLRWKKPRAARRRARNRRAA